MFLKSEHIYLRPLEPADLDFLYSLENDTQVWQVSNTSSPYARHVLQQYLDQASADIYTVKQLRLLICNYQHQPVGAIDLFDFDPAHQRAGIGITIAKTFRQQHFATEALHLISLYCREHLLLHQLYCSIATTNTSSLRLFQKAGFDQIGTRKEWIRTNLGWLDVIEFQKFLNK